MVVRAAHRAEKSSDSGVPRGDSRSVRGGHGSGEGSSTTEKVREGSASSACATCRSAVRLVVRSTEARDREERHASSPSLVTRMTGVVGEGIRTKTSMAHRATAHDATSNEAGHREPDER